MVLPIRSLQPKQREPRPPSNTGPALIVALAILLAALIISATLAVLQHDAQDQSARAVQAIDRATRGIR